VNGVVAVLLLLARPASAAGSGERGGIDVRHTIVDISCTIRRDSHNHIVRSRGAVAEFRVANPCPATGKITGACHGYDISHSWGLWCCGPDIPENMSWITHAAHMEWHRNLRACSDSVP
jgi:hypothetical protein